MSCMSIMYSVQKCWSYDVAGAKQDCVDALVNVFVGDSSVVVPKTQAFTKMGQHATLSKQPRLQDRAVLFLLF